MLNSQKISLMEQLMKRYDIIIPIGSVCKTSQNLRNLKLQNESLPFDWVLTLDINQIKEMLESHFTGFLEKENMEYKGKESEQTDVYIDTKTKIGFWHDFPHNVALSESFDAIKNKYNRRIARLYQEIEKAQDILFFRVCTIRPQSGYSIEEVIYSKTTETDEKLIRWLEDIRSLFPSKNISLLEVSLFNEPHEYSHREVQEGLKRIETYSDIKYEWEGDPQVFRKLLSDHKLKYGVILHHKFTTLKFHLHKFLVNLGAKVGIKKCQERKKWLKNRFNR